MECFERNLFGDSRNWPLGVRKGDLCLLYNYNRQIVYGLWKAESNGKKDIVPDAWKGLYKFQVKVLLASKERTGIPTINLKRIFRNDPDFYKRHEVAPIIQRELHQFLASGYYVQVVTGSELGRMEEDFRRKFPREYHCSDGHDVRSRAEQIIDEWLARNQVYHEYERLINVPEQLIPDFTVYNREDKPVYIEFWGLIGYPEYEKRRLKKCELYTKYNLYPLIELYDSDVKNIDFELKRKLSERKVEIPP